MFLTWACWMWPVVIDDTYILLRYGRNLAEGAGLTFNPTQPPVEAYSDLFFILVSAVVHITGGNSVLTLKLVNTFCGLGAIAATTIIARRLVPRTTWWFAPLIVGFCPGFAFWAVAGLETATFALLLLVAVAILALGSRPWWFVSSALLLLAALVRFETPIYVLAVAGVKLLVDAGSARSLVRSLRANIGWILAFGLPYLAYTLWRWSYFGDLIPNSVRFKVAEGLDFSTTTMSIAFAVGWWPVLALFVLGCIRPGRRVAVIATPVLVAVVMYSFSQHEVWEDVSTMAYFDRYFLHTLPCLAVVSARGLNVFGRVIGRVAAFAWMFLVLVWLLVNPISSVGRILARAEDFPVDRPPCWKEMHDLLTSRHGEHMTLAVADIGLHGYLNGGEIVDLVGLSSAQFTRGLGRDRAAYIDWISELRPDAVIITANTEGRVWRPSYRVEHELLQNPIIQSEYGITASFCGSYYVDQEFIVLERRVDLPPGTISAPVTLAGGHPDH